jgi:hypothetical protein
MSDIEKQRFEMPLEYLNRVLEGITRSLKLKSAALVCTTKSDRQFIVSLGETPPIQLLNQNDLFVQEEDLSMIDSI